MTTPMHTSSYELEIDSPRDYSTHVESECVETDVAVRGKTHNRSTRDSSTTSVLDSETPDDVDTDPQTEPRVGSRVAYYGARRKMKRQLAPLHIAVMIILMLCLCLLVFGIIRDAITPSTNTTVDSQDDYSSGASYDVFTIEHNSDVESNPTE